MTISATEQKNIITLVVGMFNAAPGATYLDDIAQVFEANGHNLTKTAITLASTDAFHSLYSAGLTASQFADKWLATLGLEDNTEAHDWVVAQSATKDRGQIILEGITLLLNSTASAFADAKQMLLNKVTVATYYSVEQNIHETDLADLQAALEGVDGTSASVDAAINKIDDIVNPPESLALTTATDNIHAGPGDSTIVGIVTATGSTFTLGDKVDGGFGDNTLQILNDQLNVTLLGKTITNVQSFILDNVSDDLDSLNLNSNGFANVTANFNDAPQVDDLEINNINKMSAVTINDLDLNEGNYLTLVYSGSEEFNNSVSLNNVYDGEVDIDMNQSGAAGTFTLNLDSVSDVYVGVDSDGSTDGAVTLNVNVNGDSDGVSISNYNGFDGEDAVVNLVLNADLQVDWWDLADDAATTTFNISGSGDLTIDEFDDHSSDVTIAGAAATGDLDITVGTDTLVSATTGSGDDRLSVESDVYFVEDSEVVIDLGGGSNTLAMWDEGGIFDNTEINDLLFSDATISNAQTLEFDGSIELYGDATLDADGLDVLSAVHVTGSIDGYGNELAFENAVEDDPDTEDDETDAGSPEVMALNVDGYIDDLYLNTGDVLDMTVTASGELDIDGVTSELLETLTVTESDDEGGTLWLDLDGADENLNALTTLTATGDNYVNVELVGEPGDPGLPATPGSYESGYFTISGYNKNGGSYTGHVLISGTSLDSGSLDVNLTGASNLDDAGAMIATALNNTGNYNASYDNATDRISYNYVVATGDVGNLSASFNANGGDDALVVSASTTTPGVAATEETDATPGAGFEALETVVVESVDDDADVSMTDVTGNFTLAVTAGDDANVSLENTGVTSVAIDAGDYAGLWASGAADMTTVAMTGMDIGCYIEDAGVTSITVTADNTEDDMGDAWVTVVDTDDLASITGTAWTLEIDASGDQGSLATIDVSGAEESAEVDLTGADLGTAVTVIVGDEDLTYTTDADNAVRETFDLVGDDTGTIEITGFFLSVGGTGDRIDFSDIAGIDSIDDLEIVLDGSDTVITSLVDGVTVDITVVGVDLTTDAYHFVF